MSSPPPTPGRDALWKWWPLAIAVAVLCMLLVGRPWSDMGGAGAVAYPALYLMIQAAAVVGMVLGSVRVRRTAPAAWTALIVVLAAMLANTSLSLLLPPGAGYAVSGVGLAVASVIFVVMGAASLAVPALLLRARTGGRRDRAGLVDATAVAAAVGILLWDVTLLADPQAHVASVDLVVRLALAVAVSGTFALLLRLAFTGVIRERAAQLMLVAGVGAAAATVLLGAGGDTVSVGDVWPAEALELLSLGVAAGATLHPSARRLGMPARTGELDSGIGQGRLAVLGCALLVPAVSAVIKPLWLAGHLGGSGGPSPAPALLLPSSLASVVVTAAVIWRMWQLLKEREDARRQLRHHATHDDLTGLPNRRALYELLREQVQLRGDAVSGQAPFALLFLDLDGFKAINDTLGHEAGDDVLVEVARRVSAVLRDGDVLARPAGDEFVAICAGPIDEPLARQVADRIHERIVPPILVRGVEASVGASIGVALPPAPTGDTTRDAELLMRLADHAMYDAKRAGGRRTVLVPRTH